MAQPGFELSWAGYKVHSFHFTISAASTAPSSLALDPLAPGGYSAQVSLQWHHEAIPLLDLFEEKPDPCDVWEPLLEHFLQTVAGCSGKAMCTASMDMARLRDLSKLEEALLPWLRESSLPKSTFSEPLSMMLSASQRPWHWGGREGTAQPAVQTEAETRPSDILATRICPSG